MKLTALIPYIIQVSYLTTALSFVKHYRKKETPRNNEEEIKKLVFRLDWIQNKKIRFLSNKEFLERCFHDKLTPNGLKISLEHTIGNQNEEFVNQCYKIQDDCAKQLIKINIKFCETTIKETEHEIKETDSKLQTNLPSTAYSNIKEQVTRNQELIIHQLGKKRGKITNLGMVSKYQKKKPETHQ